MESRRVSSVPQGARRAPGSSGEGGAERGIENWRAATERIIKERIRAERERLAASEREKNKARKEATRAKGEAAGLSERLARAEGLLSAAYSQGIHLSQPFGTHQDATPETIVLAPN